MLSRRHVVALVDLAGDRVLTAAGDGGAPAGPRLPVLDDEWPTHRDLVAAVGDPAAVLAAPPVREDDGTVVEVLRWSGTEPTLPGAAWWPLGEVDRLELGATARATLAARVGELRDGVPDDGREPWFAPGWHDEVDAWVDGVLAPLGAVRLGAGEPVKVWSLSAVLRFAVRRADGSAGDLWFKATCRGFRAEPALTAWVAALAPGRAPGIVGIDTARAWMLLEPFVEAGDDDEPTPGQLRAVAAAHARLQLDSRDHVEALLASGAPERGATATLAALADVVRDGVERPTMSADQRAAAAAAEPWLVDQVTALHGLGLPLTLVHGDLHLGNVTWAAASPIVFDWTDACVAQPYLDGRHLAANAVHHAGPDGEAAVRDGYLEVWRAAYPDVDHDRAWDLALVAEKVFTLVSYEGIYRAQPPWARWELATVTVDLLDRLVALRAAAG